MGAIEDHVVSLLAEILGEEPERGKRFPWALGDPSPNTGRQIPLPFDAVWESRRLIVEVDEDQHRRPVEFWDKSDRVTVSGVHRGEQRRIYDLRKRESARAQGYSVLEVEWARRPVPALRDRQQDIARLRELLASADDPFVRPKPS